MWERFTNEAKAAVFFAQCEAQQMHEQYVSTEHLLLGLLRTWRDVSKQPQDVWPPPPKNVVTTSTNWQIDKTGATRVSVLLEQTGVSASKVIADVIAVLVPDNNDCRGNDMRLTPRAKRAIDLAADEAKRLGHEDIRPEHLLLGLVRESEGIAGRVLKKNRASLDRVRKAIVAGDSANAVSNKPWWQTLFGK